MTLHPVLRQAQDFLSSQGAVSETNRDIGVIRACAIALTTIAAIAACVAAADLLAPTAIAIVLALVLAPIAYTLERCRLPSGVAAVLTVAVTVLGLTAGAVTLAPAVADWIGRAPDIVRSVEQKIRPIKMQLAAVENASQQITRVGPSPKAAPPPVPTPAPVTEGLLTSVLTTAPTLLAKGVYISILTIFLLACRKRYTDQLILMPRSFLNRIRMARICRDVRLRVSGYLFTLAMINAGLAAVTAFCFALAGIPDPLMWGLVFGLANFVPIVGPTVVILASALVGLATTNTVMDALLPPAILLGLNTIEANLVQPWLLSRRIVISPVAIFVMVAALVWMWGVAAAITAVPALILFHTIAQHVPPLRPLARVLATEDRYTNGHNGGPRSGTFTAFIRLPIRRPTAR